ncbi:hypothetical protein SDC9_171405 [bioreactor metagenome]|uniref:Uncharacterized protein n=1 Tax=bioreactor metagenome TaxID=1076179 RepID=A0A645GDC7_9ZZZZ
MCLVVYQHQFQTLRHQQAIAFDNEVIEPIDQIERVGARILGHRQHHRRLAVVRHQLRGTFVSTRNRRHLVQRNPPLRGDHRDLCQDFRIGRFPLQTHQPVTVTDLHPSPQSIGKPGSNAVG